ncbi:MAG TPA: hypothetical protein VH723_05805 [Candidatus Limnocylindrales bacterium]
MSDVAALVFALATAITAAFQLALALGAPWGRYAMGGAYPGRFPPMLRAGAVVQAALLAALAAVVLADAGLVFPDFAARYPGAVWLAVVVSVLAVGLNAITRSRDEKRIWLPVTLVMLASSLVVALTDG